LHGAVLARAGAFEGHGPVALLALAAELPEMHVILRMARSAFGVEFDLRGRLSMTAGAIQFRMCAEQGKTRLLAVIELPQFPAVGGVALIALGTEISLVRVVLFVAVDTLGTFNRERAAGVTLIARHGNVQAQQRKLRQIVVEVSDRFPALRLVAFIALRAELRSMNVAWFVATDAVSSELARTQRYGMTGMAFQLGVLARKLPMAVTCVIERGRLPFRRSVAARTIGAEASGVLILPLMAAVALLRYRGLHIPGPVAVLAFQV